MMGFEKIMSGEMEKCYSVSSLHINNRHKLLFASETHGGGIVLDLESGGAHGSNHGARAFPTPGGVMQMEGWPGTEHGFISIHGFYPPFKAEDSGLLLTVLQDDGSYASRELLKLPYLHRFEIAESGDCNWLVLGVLCREKNGKEDWGSPGYVAVLPFEGNGVKDPLTGNQSPQILLDGQYRNHGMWKGLLDGRMTVITASDQGAYAFYPAAQMEEWKVRQLLSEPCGEAVAFDLDGDGEDELVTISPFHGASVSIYKRRTDSLNSSKAHRSWKKIWQYPQDLEFAHSLWAGLFQGKRMVFCGHRKGGQNLMALWMQAGEWNSRIVDHNVGSSNICVTEIRGEQWLLSANHGLNQYAVYKMADRL